jgi:hypothetical protein
LSRCRRRGRVCGVMVSRFAGTTSAEPARRFGSAHELRSSPFAGRRRWP